MSAGNADKKQPPAWAVRFFRWFCNDHLSDAVMGDLLELYTRRRLSAGVRIADMLFIWNVIQFIQPFAIRRREKFTPINHFAMFRNYFKIAWRNMALQKMYTAINVGGFSLGLATCIVIGIFIRHELSFDAHYRRTADIYRVYNQFAGTKLERWTVFPAPFTAILKSDFPEIEKVARLILYHWFNAGSNLVRKDTDMENNCEEGFAYADPELLDILEIPMIYGARAPSTNRTRSSFQNAKQQVFSR